MLAGGRWLAVIAALAVWAAYFYSVDAALMKAQGLPVGWDLMPK